MWAQDQVSLARGIGSAMLAGLTLFTYLLLRLVEVKHAHFVAQEAEKGIDVESKEMKNDSDVEKEDSIDFREIEDAFFQMEKTKRPTLNFRANLRIALQALTTVAFSCHTSATLPIALIGIIFSSAIIFLCLWRKQLKYPWMSHLATNHLRGTLFFIICVTTIAVTLLASTWETDEEILDGYQEVMRVVGGCSFTLGGVLILGWAMKGYCALARRKPNINTEIN